MVMKYVVFLVIWNYYNWVVFSFLILYGYCKFYYCIYYCYVQVFELLNVIFYYC